LNLKALAILLVVPVLAWKGLHDSSEKQATINDIVIQQRMSAPQKAAFEACLTQSREVGLPAEMDGSGTGSGARALSLKFCACQSRHMVRVFSQDRYASFRSLLEARTLHDAKLANLDDDDLADEWKQKPETALFVLQLAMVGCTKMERAHRDSTVRGSGKTVPLQAPS